MHKLNVIKDNGEVDYTINIPTSIEEIINKLDILTSNINLPANYSVVALINRTNMMALDSVAGVKKGKETTMGIIPVLAKTNDPNNSLSFINIGDKIICEPFAIERSVHVYNKLSIGYTNILNVLFNNNKVELASNRAGFVEKFVGMKYKLEDVVYLVELKIIANNEIKGGSKLVKEPDPFIGKA